MPVVIVNRITRPEHLVEHFSNIIGDSALGFKYVAKYDERLLPQYPAVLIMGGPLQKEVHGTHTFAVSLRVDIYLFHAKLTEDRQTRNYNDLVKATQLVNLLEADPTLGGRVIFGWVESEVPGVNPPRQARAETVISTRISYQATQETRF